MKTGILAAIFWAVETLLLNAAMQQGILSEMAFFQAALLAAGLHDFCSACYLLLYLSAKKERKNIWSALKTTGGKIIMLAAILGGPIGMLFYLLGIQKAGSSVATSVSALYPAIGAFFSFCFFKERLHVYQWLALILSVFGTVLLGMGMEQCDSSVIGFLFALICAVSWGLEAVISAYGMKKNNISSEVALQIRQLTSSGIYLLILIPLFASYDSAFRLTSNVSFRIILLAALSGTISYLFYYKTIRCIGPSKAMALNITYTVWVIVFESILQNQLPKRISVICAVLISLGSIFATYERNSQSLETKGAD